MPKIETTHLLTLSEFIDNLKENSSVYSMEMSKEICLYNDFLKQPLTREMFDPSSENCIFPNYEVAGNSARTKKGFNFCFYFNRKTGIHSFMTIKRLAEATKENPLRFKQYPYFDNEELH